MKGVTDPSDSLKKLIKRQITNFISQLNIRWKKSHKNTEFFVISNSHWLEQKCCSTEGRKQNNPSYDKLREAKNPCYPSREKTHISDVSAKVELQALIDHSVTRIMNINQSVTEKITIHYNYNTF